ncbi:GPI mannosyltransferase 2 [Aspergillus floccosus]
MGVQLDSNEGNSFPCKVWLASLYVNTGVLTHPDLELAGVPPATAPAWAGVLISNFSHFLTVLLLYGLSLRVFGGGQKAGSLALVTAGLHIVSPAGLFLSAPNAESPFALFHILGMLSYTESLLCRRNGAVTRSDLWLLLSGASVGMAAAVRSNGLISGFYFAYGAISAGSQVFQGRISVMQIRQLVVIVISGILVALGFVLPQIVAYREYCALNSYEQRPWCSAMPPSIYSFVQEHYWNNGLFRYWTVSNIPLFALAGPILAIMIVSSVWASNFPRVSKTALEGRRPAVNSTALLPIFAVPQAFIAVYILTAGHVQIINRLSSGYPVWYWWIAGLMDKSSKPRESGWDAPKWITRWMVMYALIQAALYSSFLPPA